MTLVGGTFPIWFTLVYLLGSIFLLVIMRRYSGTLSISGGWKSGWSLWQVVVFRLSFVLLLISVCMLILRPVLYASQKENVFVDHESMLVLDVSPSMYLESAQGNSWQYVEQSALAFVQNMHDRKVGIVVFSGETILFSPLTSDADFLQQQIENIDTYSFRQSEKLASGTAIGDAILMATKHLVDSGTKGVPKSIMLVTDGDANIGFDPQTAAQYASKHSIRIDTIGIGDPQGAFYDLSDAYGQQYVTVYLDETLLASIAQNTGGTYTRAYDVESMRVAMETAKQNTSGPWQQIVTTHSIHTNELWFWMGFVSIAVCILLQVIYPRIQPGI